MRLFNRNSRMSLRLNAGSQVALECAKSFSNIATAPLRVSQSCVSAVAVSKAESSTEALIHALHSAIAITQASLIIAITFDEECADRQTRLCDSAFIFELLYQGLLIFSWAHSEINKDDENNHIGVLNV